MEKQCCVSGLEIIAGDVSHAGVIARFQLQMAMESEGLALDDERVRGGVLAVLSDSAKGRYFVARLGDALVGCLMVTREWSDWNCCWYWWIQSVYVIPAFRGRGIYRAMYGKVLELARAAGVSQVRLYVDKDNSTAQEVYKNLGMAECHYCMYEVDLRSSAGMEIII